ncbi:putative Se/S carrier-like protein [Petrotoga sp. DB-2]
MSKDMRTTLDLDLVLINENYQILEIKEMLTRNGVFCKIFPSPKSVLQACAPVICLSSRDKEKAIYILDENGVKYDLVKLEKDIIWELLRT